MQGSGGGDRDSRRIHAGARCACSPRSSSSSAVASATGVVGVDVTGPRRVVDDSCAGTLTRGPRGRVRVTDFGRRRTVTVRAGGRSIAR